MTIPPYAYHTPFMVKSPDKCGWQNRFKPGNKGDLVRYTDRSKTNKDTGIGVYRRGSNRRHNFSLWLHPLFQGELYSITAYVRGNTEKDYTGRRICIPSDSHATIKDLESFRINSKSLWVCHHYVPELATLNSIQLLCVTGNVGIDGSEIANQVDRQGSSHPRSTRSSSCR